MKASYTIYELAEVWNCHWATLYRMIKAGKLHAFKVGRTWRIKYDERIRVETSSPAPAANQNPRIPKRQGVRVGTKVQTAAKRKVEILLS